jgi:hypothetical protein
VLCTFLLCVIIRLLLNIFNFVLKTELIVYVLEGSVLQETEWTDLVVKRLLKCNNFVYVIRKSKFKYDSL